MDALITALIARQLEEGDVMSRAFTNLKKKGDVKSRGAIQARMTVLENRWTNLSQRHEEIVKLKNSSTETLDYFESQTFYELEEVYQTEMTKFHDALHALNHPRAAPAANSVLTSAGAVPPRRRLPSINVPKFSGRYSEWTSFRDYFASLIHSDDYISDLERLHYLKSSLTGEAERLVRHIPVTADNYDRAWTKLASFYDNKRALIHACLDTFLHQKSLAGESHQALKTLRDTTSDVVESLQALDRPVDQMADFIVHLTVRRFDPQTRRDWELSLGDSPTPLTWPQVDAFLKSRIQALEMSSSASAASRSQADRRHQGPRSVTTLTTSKSTSRRQTSCSFCGRGHYIAACDEFRAAPPPDRHAHVADRRLCFNCLGNHPVRECRSTKSCRTCHRNHHSLLHRDGTQQSSTAPSTGHSNDAPPLSAHTARTSAAPPRRMMLATAQVVVSSYHRTEKVRALIDPCSEASFCTEALSQRLKLSRKRAFVPVTGIGAAPSYTARSRVSLILASHFDATSTRAMEALVLPRLTEYLPPPTPIITDLAFLQGLCLADPQPHSLGPIEMILGADVYTVIIESGLRKGPNDEVIAQATTLGWIVTGTSEAANNPSTVAHLTRTGFQGSTDPQLCSLLENFWTQEEVATPVSVSLTPDELACEAHFRTTTQRDLDGRYVLRLPFKDDVTRLGDSEPAARSSLRHVENRCRRQPQFAAQYAQFLREYLSLGHMTPSTADPVPVPPRQSFFLPHHGVLKSTGETTKLRVVFNGSVRLNDGLAINDCLHAGPKLQGDLVDVLLRWRQHRYVFSADIEKMYRQIRIAAEDQPYQQILWRAAEHLPVQVYRLRTITYGLTSSPFQAIRTLHQLAQDEGDSHPRAAALLRENTYVDDILAGADTIHDAITLRDDLTRMLMAGGFPLSKWTANDPIILSTAPGGPQAPPHDRTWYSTAPQHMLGVRWQPVGDVFEFQFSSTRHPEPMVVTKRSALSLIAQLYDPLGWITPVTVRFKVFMQSLWHTGLQWDEALPSPLRARWDGLTSQLPQLHLFSIPRWIGLATDLRITEIHGFSDASERAFAACVYLRAVTSSGDTKCILLTSKTKVAPLKQISLPRLELCGAVLLVRLVRKVQTTLSMSDIPCHLWSDSTIVLSWIKEHPTTWKTYVANRVAEVQITLPQAHWRHVPGKENPADLASRGLSPVDLSRSTLWMHGPPFLTDLNSNWALTNAPPHPEECPEKRSTACLILNAAPPENELLHRYSSITKLLRITLRCQDFAARTRPMANSHSPYRIFSHHWTPTQLRSALHSWIRQVQRLHYPLEIGHLKRHRPLSRTGPLIRLSPTLDDQGMLRVGGRLRHATLHPDQKHPLILPRQSYLTQLLVWDAHERTHHGGTQATLNHLRQQFWIIRGRQLVKTTVFKCLRCWRHSAQPASQLMGDLPPIRVQPTTRPFLHTGLDYAGPINLRLSKGRGTHSYKGYIAVFVCLATRAVHLEVASGYSTSDFLHAYRRFIGRRGICASLFSDCGTNFIGADRELRNLFQEASSQSKEIASLLANDGTDWIFNPPAAPHFGGIWEAAVRSVKHHLKRILGETLLTFDELTTLLTQIEACLNSRPLTPMSDDASDLSALTPAHFLVGSPLSTIPEPSMLNTNISHLSRWQLVRQMYEHFWARWSAEYLPTLQHRSKWRLRRRQVAVGDLCLLRSEPQPPCKWPLARVTRTFPGPDGLTRVVDVRTATSTLRRPIVKLSLFPSSSDSPEIGEGGRDVRD